MAVRNERLRWSFLVVIVVLCSFFHVVAAIDDPFHIFCGSHDCYEILGVQKKESDQKAIKKAYRKLALTLHPDKNPDVDTTEAFREAAKAMEVLSDLEQKELYDYYLDHPREYYKVTGKFYYKQLPKADVRVILAGLVLFLSVLMPIVQYQKWKRATDYLRYAATNNLSLASGGTKATQELHRRAAEMYEAELAEKSKGGKDREKVKPGKMMKDPVFIRTIDQLVGEVQVEGGYRKPTWRDVFAVQLVILPYHLMAWARRRYRYHYQADQMSNEEKDDAACVAVGMAVWETLTDRDKDFLVDSQAWINSGALEELIQRKQQEALDKRPGMKKKYQRYMKNKSA